MSMSLTADRFKTWTGIALLAAITMGVIWYWHSVTHFGGGDDPSLQRKEPDYYIERFNYIKISNNGKANYHVTGDRLQHLPVTDQIEIFQPLIHSYDARREPVTLRADRALVEQKSAAENNTRQEDKVHLHGDVRVVQAEPAHPEFMQLTTSYLMLLPDTDKVITDQAVELLTPRVRATAVGLEADQITQQLQLRSQVKVHVQPRSMSRTATTSRNPS